MPDPPTRSTFPWFRSRLSRMLAVYTTPPITDPSGSPFNPLQATIGLSCRRRCTDSVVFGSSTPMPGLSGHLEIAATTDEDGGKCSRARVLFLVAWKYSTSGDEVRDGHAAAEVPANGEPGTQVVFVWDNAAVMRLGERRVIFQAMPKTDLRTARRSGRTWMATAV